MVIQGQCGIQGSLRLHMVQCASILKAHCISDRNTNLPLSH